LIKKIKTGILTPLNVIAHPLEKLWSNEKDIKYLDMFPPIFIIGSPRSGTTVLYQLLCKHLQFGYINNFVSNWPKAPLTATKLYKRFSKNSNPIELNSKFGDSSHMSGPSEYGEFWYRWFERSHKFKFNNNNIKKLRIEISGLTKIHHRPLIFKNVVHSMRILALRKVFSDSVFIVLKRKKLDIAQSILNARIHLYNDKNHPFSVVSSQDQLDSKISYGRAIISQINSIYSNIDLAGNTLGMDKFIFVKYKDLCDNTEKILKNIQNELEKRNQNIPFNKNKVPDKLKYSTGQKVSDEDYKLLKNEIKKYDRIK